MGNIESILSNLKTQNSEVFGHIIRRKWMLPRRIGKIQKALDRRFSRHLLELDCKLRVEYEKILDEEELLWKQKSRVDQIQFGDRNTKFFHNKALTRRSLNKISALKIDDQWCYDNDVLQEEAVRFFSALQSLDDPSFHSFPLYGCFPILDSVSLGTLEVDITNDDIKSALFSMGSLKVSGPDGFHALFYQSQWETIGTDVCNWVHGVFSNQSISSNINKTFLVLIPKTKFPESMGQLRPISLCNVLYKVVTKVIVNRLKPVFPSLIALNQVSFVAGRWIKDNIVIAQEVVHSMPTKKGKKSWMVIKVDLEKAYDRLKWDFIRDTLSDVGFPSNLSRIIMECISTASMQIFGMEGLRLNFFPVGALDKGAQCLITFLCFVWRNWAILLIKVWMTKLGNLSSWVRMTLFYRTYFSLMISSCSQKRVQTRQGILQRC